MVESSDCHHELIEDLEGEKSLPFPVRAVTGLAMFTIGGKAKDLSNLCNMTSPTYRELAETTRIIRENLERIVDSIKRDKEEQSI